MDEVKCGLVRAWLTKARNDLETASQIGSLPNGHLDMAIYHCQQAAEKAVKGYLTFKDHRIERSHDVELLVGLAEAYEPSFGKWVDAALMLTPYATFYRYPGESDSLEPSREEFDDAFEQAADLMDYVFALLPPDVRPS